MQPYLQAAQLINTHVWGAPCVAQIVAILQQATTVYLHTPHGVAVASIVPPEADLLWIVATPPQQGHGTALLQQFQQVLKTQHGVQTLYLEVAARNTAAQKLYAKCNGVVCGHRKAYYTVGNQVDDAIVMRCRL
jgi:[ribosomal protein S18]-alanine N-acetyltransferase